MKILEERLNEFALEFSRGISDKLRKLIPDGIHEAILKEFSSGHSE